MFQLFAVKLLAVVTPLELHRLLVILLIHMLLHGQVIGQRLASVDQSVHDDLQNLQLEAMEGLLFVVQLPALELEQAELVEHLALAVELVAPVVKLVKDVEQVPE